MCPQQWECPRQLGKCLQHWGNVHDGGGNVRDSRGNVRDSGGNVCNSGEICSKKIKKFKTFTTLHRLLLRIHGITCQKAIRI